MTTNTRFADYEVGGKLKHEREGQRCTQADLGSRVGISEQQMSRYERGINSISIVALCWVAKKLSTDVGKLLPKSTAP
ncbi:MAG: helix-turn-helix domain-containing protein [Wolbachia sp.]